MTEGATAAALLGVVGGWEGASRLFTGMTEGATAAALLGVAGMGSRLHGNDGGGRE